ncbi:MAG: PCRF domain-containing protein, partial [Coriobacteriales bacterium]|nr:PCRF domain-containing protein [Coriobacteriales bacterium]
MYEKLKTVIESYRDLEKRLSDPEIIANQKEFTRLAKEHSFQSDMARMATTYVSDSDNLAINRDLLETESDPEMKEFIQGEIDELNGRLEELEEEIKQMLVPTDPND